jgi:hypothetical protein
MRKVIVLKIVLEADDAGDAIESAAVALGEAAAHIVRETKARIFAEGTLLDLAGYGPIKVVDVEELPFEE